MTDYEPGSTVRIIHANLAPFMVPAVGTDTEGVVVMADQTGVCVNLPSRRGRHLWFDFCEVQPAQASLFDGVAP